MAEEYTLEEWAKERFSNFGESKLYVVESKDNGDGTVTIILAPDKKTRDLWKEWFKNNESP